MASSARKPSGVVLPRRTRRYRFSMTPLADIMFQLLVFFMLSANIAPYSMLDLRTGGLSGSETNQETETEASQTNATDTRTTAVWTLSGDGSITARGQRFTLDRLPALADALLAQGTADVLVITRDDAAVQNVVNVLQLLAARGITSVQIAGSNL